MLINKENIGNVFISLKTTFNNAFGAAPSNWKKVAMLVPSTTSQNDYSWMSNFPKMREWIGDKVVKSLAAFNYTIKNKDFEATVEVDRNDIDDDNLGIYGPQAQMAGLSAAELPDDIVFALLNNGFINLCYDGQYFFDVDHPVKQLDGSIAMVSNKGNAELSIKSLAAADFSV
ncbi:MAG: Mu-like prophage major head subunit gpT family protein, partial [Pseudomonadota bacterium]|nr:Mu-like prophage major head subunit gpT family protein [Pseudomonadota bacterium]